MRVEALRGHLTQRARASAKSGGSRGGLSFLGASVRLLRPLRPAVLLPSGMGSTWNTRAYRGLVEGNQRIVIGKRRPAGRGV